MKGELPTDGNNAVYVSVSIQRTNLELEKRAKFHRSIKADCWKLKCFLAPLETG
jgi:hypothetical protein